MKRISLTIAGLLATTGLLVTAWDVKALREQSQPTDAQMYDACTANRAEILPIPFSDLEPNHWAFSAVMNLYYCGFNPDVKSYPHKDKST